MKILHSIETWFNPTENWIYDQIRATGLSQDILCSTLRTPLPALPSGTVFLRKNDGPLEQLKIKLTNRFNINFSRNDRFSGYHDYDILFSHFGYQAWQDLLCTPNARMKRIVRFYGIDLDFTYRIKYWPERYRVIFRDYHKVVAEGVAMKLKLQQFGCAPEKIVILHHGIIPFAELAVRDFSRTNRAFKCLICGRFAEKKGFPDAVHALGELKKRYRVPVELTIIGDAARDNDFREKEQMQELDRRYDLRARFLGMVSLEEMNAQMAQNDFFLSPSVTPDNGDIEGGFPTTLIHAANHGMILVGTHHCDIPEIIIHGKNGYLAPERDVEQLVAHLRALSRASAEELRAMSAYSHHLVKEQFNLAVEGEALKSLYQQTIMDS
ncbi:MAG: glycosyltransferase family 4 protein [Candidatus Zhuqueibacterota bacterium]